MKCLICAKFCLNVVCEKCLDSIPLRPSVREVSGVSVYCFFAYSDIDFLLNAKYYAIGSRIYSALGKIAGEYFFSQKAMIKAISQIIENTAFGEIKLIGMDDCVRSFYSHTGVLVREFARASVKSSKKPKNLRYRARYKSSPITPIYGELKATNQVSYAGKSLAFRQANKRRLTLSANISKPKGADFGVPFIRDMLDFGSRFRADLKRYFAKDFAIGILRDFDTRFRSGFSTILQSPNTAQNQSLANDSNIDSNVDYKLESKVDSNLPTSSAKSAPSLDAGCVIIVDDVITTGTSFGEAIEVCQKRGLKVLFCLSLCNAAL